MTSPINKKEESNIKQLIALKEAKSLKNILVSGGFSVDISSSIKGARINSSIDLGNMNKDLQKFIINSFSNNKDKNIEVELEGVNRALKTKIFYTKEVGENYLTSDDLAKDAKRHVLRVFSECLKVGLEDLKKEIKNPGFPKIDKTKPEPFGKNDKGAILRFIERIRPSNCFGMN